MNQFSVPKVLFKSTEFNIIQIYVSHKNIWSADSSFLWYKTCEDFLFFMPTHIRRETACSIKVHIIKPYEVKRDYIYAILSTYVNNYTLTDVFHNISAFWIRLYFPLVVSSGTMIVLLSVCIIKMWSVIVVMLPNLIFFLLFWRFLFITSRWVEKAAGV